MNARLHRWSAVSLLVATAAFAQGKERHTRPLPALVPLALGQLAHEQVPLLKSTIESWGLTGSRPSAYEIRCDDIQSNCAIPILRSKQGAQEPLGTGSLTHAEPAEKWRGKKVRLRAELRAGRIDGWAGLWVRIDDAQGEALAFDNMQNRALRGTGSFEWHSVVLDVPPTAERITLGILLRGPGAVFIRELDFEEAEASALSTDLLKSLEPTEAPMVSTVGAAAGQQQPVSGSLPAEKK